MKLINFLINVAYFIILIAYYTFQINQTLLVLFRFLNYVKIKMLLFFKVFI